MINITIDLVSFFLGYIVGTLALMLITILLFIQDSE